MSAITILAPIKLAHGKTEADLLAASRDFQDNFVAHEPGVLRRELVRNPDGTYLDIVQFRTAEDVQDITQKEMNSPVCARFFAVMDMSDEAAETMPEALVSLATYQRR